MASNRSKSGISRRNRRDSFNSVFDTKKPEIQKPKDDKPVAKPEFKPGVRLFGSLLIGSLMKAAKNDESNEGVLPNSIFK